ncbi:hypothetical protein RCH09_002577 [Actimicrobium sp. GrIS 1.19]|uniref:DUF1272 domain-containing protein n=1 Tax=Actimicrobium sp. GrIS 1.19 TaxID=3071708 RepID=UPI002DF8DB4A|nr:hypothetical protein [Actimicrobium sp. GrIS 1.19]
MLELRPCCENCDVDLPPDSASALICTFECTFCRDCAQGVLQNVCPNCGGGLTDRPVRPQAMLLRNPASTLRIVKPLVGERAARHAALVKQYCAIAPHRR